MLTGTPKCDGPEKEVPPYEPDPEWSKDADAAFQALTDEDYKPTTVDFEDAICGP